MVATAAVDPRWMRGPADESAVALFGCYFDEAAGEAACHFITRFLRLSTGRGGPKRFRLLDWQRDFLMRLFGWRRPGGRRRFRYAYLEIAKKNGKSTLVAAIALYLLIGDDEWSANVHVNACDKRQAGIIFAEASKMLGTSPALSQLVRVYNSDDRQSITFPARFGKLTANSGEVDGKDGADASGVIFDELHRQRGRALWEVFEYAGAAREQPLRISITTAGEDDSGVWHEQREYSERVNSGEIDDFEHLGVVYRADPDDDLDDPETWRKANPSLGVTIDPETFRRELQRARRTPRGLAYFKRTRLNIIAAGAASFVDVERWDAQAGPPRKLAEFARRPCWAGLDLSSSQDLTALVALFGDRRSGFDALAWFWCPEEMLGQLEAESGMPYRQWAKDGHIVATPGNVIDYEYVRSQVRELAKAVDLRKLLADPSGATQLALQLAGEDGLPVQTIRQGFGSIAEPTRELERLYLAGKIRHGGNPVLRWHAGNAVVVTNGFGDIRLHKRKSAKKIDGMAAIVDALAATDADPAPPPSVYQTRGIRSV